LGYVETLFGHQDSVVGLDSLKAETAVSVGGRDKTVRFWKIVDESQLVFRGGGRSRVREVLEGDFGGVDDGMDRDERGKTGEKKYVEGSLECVAMVDETNFVSGGDSGFVLIPNLRRTFF
jgi:ribosomal RNA-processing protein 9